MAELARPLLVYPLFRYGLPTAYHGTSSTHQPDDLSLQYTCSSTMATYSSGSSRVVDVVVLLGIGFKLLLDCFEVGVLLVANSLLQNQGLVSVDLDLNHGGFCSAGEFDFSPFLRLQDCEMFLLVASLSLSAIHWGSEGEIER